MRNVPIILLIAIISTAAIGILIQPVKSQSGHNMIAQATFSTDHLYFAIELFYDQFNISSFSIKFTVFPQAVSQGETPNIHIDVVKFEVHDISALTNDPNGSTYTFTLASNVDLYFNHNITRQISGFVPSNIGNPPPHYVRVDTADQHHLLPSSETTNAKVNSTLLFEAYDHYVWGQQIDNHATAEQATHSLNGLAYIFYGATVVLFATLVALWGERRKLLKKLELTIPTG